MKGQLARAAAILAMALSSVSPARAAVPVPGEPESRPIALVGGTVHTVSGETIPGATVLF